MNDGATPVPSAKQSAWKLDMISDNPEEIESRFYGQLKFGTAGLRGIMGVGLSMMNVHVIRHTTQAFAEVILEEGAKTALRGVAICYDCRNNSRAFAEAAACVMAANKIPVRFFESMRPTPETLVCDQALWLYGGYQHHRQSQSERIQRL